MGTITALMENVEAQGPLWQISDLRNTKEGLDQLVKLYFTYHGQTKRVAQHLGIRRNTVIDMITERMIPHVANLWIQQCDGRVMQLAQRLGLQNDEKFHKTLRWHHRFENYLTSIEVDSTDEIAIAKSLHFLRNIPEPLLLPPQKSVSFDFSSPEDNFLYRMDPSTDNPESISRKITKLKTMKFGTMMILGETGAGKGWLAQRIYKYLYPHEEKPYLHINCAHLMSAMVELYGSVKGAFTDAVDKPGAFELIAEGGILFLDEIDSLPLDVQTKLLLVLGEEGVFYRVGSTRAIHLKRFTLITATHQNLEAMAQKNLFRRDLLGRINQPCIRLKTWHQQPLEVRLHIIKELQSHICENDFESPFSDHLQKDFYLTEDQIEILLHSHYTYNVRSVRKQITEFMTQFLMNHKSKPLAPFRFY